MRHLLVVAVTSSLLLSVARPAAADSQYVPTKLVQVAPSDGQVDVPLNARVRLFLASDDGDATGPAVDLDTVTLTNAGAPVTATVLQPAEPADLDMYAVELVPAQPLDPNTVYQVTVTDAYDAKKPISTSFTTGAGLISPVKGKPRVEILDLRFGDVGANVVYNKYGRLRITPAALDATGLSLIRIARVHDSEPVVFSSRPLPEGDSFDVDFSHQARASEEVCIQIWQEDGTGNTSLRSDVVCDAGVQDEAVGCSASTAPAGRRGASVLGFLALALGGLARRAPRRAGRRDARDLAR